MTDSSEGLEDLDKSHKETREGWAGRYRCR